jgi:hypothetical protein
MRKIHILATAAVVLVAATAPSLAASRHRAMDAYASGATTDRSGSYYYGPQRRTYQQVSPYDAYGSAGAYRGGNEPYADRPYGDPDSW